MLQWPIIFVSSTNVVKIKEASTNNSNSNGIYDYYSWVFFYYCILIT